MNNLKRLWNIIVALFFLPFFKLFHKDNGVILIGGHEGKIYEDNSKHMYEYYLKKGEDVYWVINKCASSENIPGKIVFRGTVLNYLLYFNSKAVMYSHSKSDTLPLIHRFYTKKDAIHVFLGHGPDGLKKQKKTSKESLISRLIFPTYNIPQADMYIALSNYEMKIKHDYWGIPTSKIQVTGLPRFDTLIDNATMDDGINVLYMPTWREWFDGESLEEIKTSPLIRSLVDLLNVKEYSKMLSKYHITINIYGHIFLQDTLNRVLGDKYKKIENIKFLSDTEDVQELMRNANVMVTDYSSVAFDFLYMNKPVIFFQPDKTQYLSDRGSYINFDKELFGEQILTLTDLIKKLQWISIENNISKYIDEECTFRDKYFNFFDHENCKRVDKVVMKRLNQ